MAPSISKEKMNGQEEMHLRYVKIAGAISLYWFVSILMVFVNKYLLSSPELKLDAPFFITWYQCVFSLVGCYVGGYLGNIFPTVVAMPPVNLDKKISRELLPLSAIFVGMIAFNNLTLKHMGIAFYNVGRSLTMVFSVILTYLLLGKGTSCKAIACCGVVIAGFWLGVDQEGASGTLSVLGVIFGILASLFVALNAIFTSRHLPTVNNNVWRLTAYNNLNAIFLFLPCILFNGELSELRHFQGVYSVKFWATMNLAGLCGFAMGYVTGLQIQMTSPLTHNISGTGKAAAQTVIAVFYFAEIKTALWWLSNAVVLGGSGGYTWVRGQEMRAERQKSGIAPPGMVPTVIEKRHVTNTGGRPPSVHSPPPLLISGMEGKTVQL